MRKNPQGRRSRSPGCERSTYLAEKSAFNVTLAAGHVVYDIGYRTLIFVLRHRVAFVVQAGELVIVSWLRRFVLAASTTVFAYAKNIQNANRGRYHRLAGSSCVVQKKKNEQP